MKRFAWILPLGIFIVGCGSATSDNANSAAAKKDSEAPPLAAIKEGPDQNLMPFVQGNEYAFDLDGTLLAAGRSPRKFHADQSMRVTEVKSSGGKTFATITMSSNGKSATIERYYADEQGIFQTASGRNAAPIDPPQPVVLFPLEKNKSFNYKGKMRIPSGDELGMVEISNKVLPAQEVDTASGRVSAIPVESKVTFKTKEGKPGRMATMTYFQPGVGVVRIVQEVAIPQSAYQVTMRLKQAVKK